MVLRENSAGMEPAGHGAAGAAPRRVDGAQEQARLKAELASAHEEIARLRRGRRASQLVERIFESVPAGVGYLDKALVFRRVNPAFATLLGRELEDFQDRALFEALPNAGAQLEPILRAVLETGRPVANVELPILDGSGKTRYGQLGCVPLAGASGEVEGLLVSEVDVSELVRNERARRREVEDLRIMDHCYKDEFLSVISHELRTPLNFIVGFASLLDDEAAGSLNDRQHEFLGKILNGSDRMLILVNDLLDFAKVRAGKLDLDPQPTPYEPLLREVVETMGPLARDRDHSLTLEVDVPGLPVVDGARILQVVTNLVSNAIKFTPNGGQVTVRAHVAGGEVVTQVTDSGIGIASHELPKLFTRFQQLDMSKTRRAGGTGLGLAISKALVEAHGGQIGVVSEPEAGSTFWFTLPFAGPPADLEGAPPA